MKLNSFLKLLFVSAMLAGCGNINPDLPKNNSGTEQPDPDSPATISFGGREDVSRPTMFYYLLLRTKSGNSGKPLSQCSASEIKCAAFVRSHNIGKGISVNEKDMMSVSDLEKITGFTYFANVPQAPKDTYNANDWGL